MPPKGHRRCRSSELDGSEMSQVKSVYSTICTQLEALSKRIATTDAEAVYITVRSLLEDIEDVEKARASVPKGKSLDVVSIPFSEVTATHYDRFGVKTNPYIWIDQLITLTLWSFVPKDRQIAKNLKNIPSLIRGIRKIADHTDTTKHEPGCRMLIDQFLYSLVDQCNETKLHIRLFPELRLSEKSKAPVPNTAKKVPVPNKPKKVPATVWFDKYATIITGVTDYGVVTVKDETRGAQLDSANYRSLNKSMHSEDLLFVLEAKGDSSDLVDDIPQAVAQCLSVINATDVKWKVTEVSFCLSNGTSWIFGVVSQCPSDPAQPRGSSGYSVVRSNAFSCKPGEVVPLERHSTVLEVQEIIQLLYIWATVPSSSIRAVLNNEVGPSN